MNRKIVNIQALRGIAALMVLLPHLRNYDIRFGGDHLPGHALWEVGNAGVDLFFVISGFVMVATTLGKFGRAGEPGRFLFRRAVRIYPLYWVISLLVLPVYLKHRDLVNAHDGTARLSIWKSFLLLPQGPSPLIAQGWTLIHELYFYVIFALMLSLKERWLPMMVVVWGVLVTAGYYALPHTTSVIDIAVNPLTLEFILGCFIALASHRLTRGGLPIFIAGIILLCVLGPHATDLHNPWQRVGYFGAPAALVVLGSVCIERSGMVMPKWLVATGDASYSFYLTQGLVLAAVSRWAWEKKHIHTGRLPNLLTVVAMSVAAIIAAFVCYRLVELPLVAITKKWTDRKRSSANATITNDTPALTSGAR